MYVHGIFFVPMDGWMDGWMGRCRFTQIYMCIFMVVDIYICYFFIYLTHGSEYNMTNIFRVSRILTNYFQSL